MTTFASMASIMVAYQIACLSLNAALKQCAGMT